MKAPPPPPRLSGDCAHLLWPNTAPLWFQMICTMWRALITLLRLTFLDMKPARHHITAPLSSSCNINSLRFLSSLDQNRLFSASPRQPRTKTLAEFQDMRFLPAPFSKEKSFSSAASRCSPGRKSQISALNINNYIFFFSLEQVEVKDAAVLRSASPTPRRSEAGATYLYLCNFSEVWENFLA